MIYNTGTIAINGNTATGTGTNWTAPASQVRAGQTIIVMSNPVQMFQISSVNSATSMTVTPAASPALSGQKYGILVSDNISVDGLAQAMSQLIKEYDENIGAWETFATTSANQSITVTINGTAVTIPGIGKLAQKGSNGAVTVADGGTGATNAADARTKLGLGEAAKRDVGTGANQLPDMSSFQSILSTHGYQRLPGGIIIQWGLAPAPVGIASQRSYPITFPNAVWHVFMCHNVPNDPSGLGLSGASVAPGNSVFDYMIQAIKVSGTTVTATPAGTTNMSLHFFAIGY
ncbi:gp53-like domain-containing protein [Escherichia coli]